MLDYRCLWRRPKVLEVPLAIWVVAACLPDDACGRARSKLEKVIDTSFTGRARLFSTSSFSFEFRADHPGRIIQARALVARLWKHIAATQSRSVSSFLHAKCSIHVVSPKKLRPLFEDERVEMTLNGCQIVFVSIFQIAKRRLLVISFSKLSCFFWIPTSRTPIGSWSKIRVIDLRFG